MKAKMLRDEEITHPDLKSQADVVALRGRLHREEITPQQWRDRMFLTVKAGTVIDHPHAWRLCQMGMAEPFDQECRDRCETLRVNVEAAAEAQDRTRLAQLTGNPVHDRDNDAAAELREELADQREQAAANTDPQIVAGNEVLSSAIVPK